MPEIINGTIVNIALRGADARFEISLSRYDEAYFPCGRPTERAGYEIWIIINEKRFSIGFHYTAGGAWLSMRLDRDGHNLTEVLTEYGFAVGDNVILEMVEEGVYKLRRV